MNVLVIGSGGREHALVWKLKQSTHVGKLYCAPGNPGIESLAECVALTASDLPGMLRFAHEKDIGLTIVGPEQPLAEGIVDLFEGESLKIFGPTKRAAELEWSKAFAKDFMHRHRIPTAHHQTFTVHERNQAIATLESSTFPLVLKADGLAAGKGVIICNDRHSAMSALHEMMDEKAFGPASEAIVIEEFMTGEEASVFAISDGTDYVTLAPAQDHKRALDDDQGKNTGGMGAYAPAPVVTPEVLELVQRQIIEPTLIGMEEEGRPYKGCLYVGLMITAEGPKVVEYNCRFGDPETQVVLPLYIGDIVEIMLAACEGRISTMKHDEQVSNGSAVCVVLTSFGYPDRYHTGRQIYGLESLDELKGVLAFHAGTRHESDSLVTAGGRVLGITAWERNGTLQQTILRAYQAVERVSFEGMHFRKDIGKKVLPASGVAS